ncbi:MAG: hypothetical protein JO366_10390 [Methylobacteriaceae bacterium]|nr:hypothetical protein [Methylobacteriaceae bacterium]MBV9220344.1 hypothetical protein [Methylobacteriaceae bacterium]MBV9245205.1 hypothetical protein [Methylobacteriaceae bacterium]MBV9637092.1 hypothetical protein [Methylobacteriaceae bacterium]MBV9702775.1 hypothetical protein [Methylobacteriaceae bacterium]
MLREKYERKALKCLRASEMIADVDERKEMLEIAQAWLKLAEHVRVWQEDGVANVSPLPAGAGTRV